MSNLVEFAFEGRAVRVELDERGEPLFNANDVCAVLEFGNPYQALSDNVDKDDLRKTEVIDALGRTQQANYLTESGLYALIFGSRKPEAKRFQRWVTSDVLPSIRKTGGYGNAVITLLDDEKASRSFLAYKAVADAFGLSKNAALIAADNAVARDYGISFKEKLQITLQAEDNEVPLLVSEIGSMLGFEGSAVKRGAPVNGLLVELGYQERVGKSWVPTAKGAPYAFVSQTGKKHKDGTPVTQVKWKRSVVELLRSVK